MLLLREPDKFHKFYHISIGVYIGTTGYGNVETEMKFITFQNLITIPVVGRTTTIREPWQIILPEK